MARPKYFAWITSNTWNAFAQRAWQEPTFEQHKTWLHEDMAEAMLRSNITEEHAAGHAPRSADASDGEWRAPEDVDACPP